MFLKVISKGLSKQLLKILALLALCLCFCVLQAAGQSGRQGLKTAPVETENQADDTDDLIRVRAEEILVPVTVRDQTTGAHVSGLKPESFFIYDNGERQEIASFNRQRVPANIVLLLDASGSVFGQMRFIREAAKNFTQGLMPEDKVCVMQFADRVELLQDWTQGTDSRGLAKALDWRYHPGQSTTFYDGLYLAATEQLKRVEGRKVVILLTDGIDTGERKHASFTDALNAVRRAEASVYVISLTEYLRVALSKYDKGWLGRIFGGYDPRQIKRYQILINEAEGLLEKIAAETGGRMFLPRKDEDLLPAYRAVAEELQAQYIITYKPKKRAAAGEYRRIRVLVSPGIYEINTRDGYVGRA
jgi:von Willebrand factor type A domain.